MIDRVIILVLDSVGVGYLPDAERYGDKGANTVANIADAVGGLKLPNLQSLGLGNIIPIQGVNPSKAPMASFGKMATASPTKDSTGGHWELSGVVLRQPFPIYPDGFPKEIMDVFAKEIGRPFLGNIVASGTEIIKELAEKHLATGWPIVYTSSDSVFQIAAHEKVVPVEQLYQWCLSARKILQGEHAVARVIARPFTGDPGSCVRTNKRKDFSLQPPGETMLDIASSSGFDVSAVGKIDDIFAGRGITRSIHTGCNEEGTLATLNEIKNPGRGIIFTNLVDFDMLYGHRNDVSGYTKALRKIDQALPEYISALTPGDVFVITADHGCDPTFKGTDHTREYVPLLIYGRMLKKGVNLGIRASLADLGATVCDLLNLRLPQDGISFAGEILQ